MSNTGIETRVGVSVQGGRTSDGRAKFRIWPGTPSLTALTGWMSWPEAWEDLARRGARQITPLLKDALAEYDEVTA